MEYKKGEKTKDCPSGEIQVTEKGEKDTAKRADNCKHKRKIRSYKVRSQRKGAFQETDNPKLLLKASAEVKQV